MNMEKYPDETSGDDPILRDPGPARSGAAWKDGVTPTPSAPAPSPPDGDPNPRPEATAEIPPERKDAKAPLGKEAEEPEPAARMSSLRRWLPAGLLLVGLAALWAKMRK